MSIRIKSYEEFCDEHAKYDGSHKCFVQGCDEPAYYEGGDSRFYCGMCEEHAGMKEAYRIYLKHVERRLRVRILWDKDDITLGPKLDEVLNKLKEVE